MADCIFCKIIAGEIPSAKVGESAECIAFRDIAPQAPVHVLVVPRVHVQSMNELSDGQVLGSMGMLARQVAQELGIAAQGYRTVINTGEHGGQTVGHIHLHLLGGRALKWTPG